VPAASRGSCDPSGSIDSERSKRFTPSNKLVLFFQANPIRGAAMLMTVILALLLIALAGLGGWFVVRALGGRRR